MSLAVDLSDLPDRRGDCRIGGLRPSGDELPLAPACRAISLATRSDTLSSLSRSTISGSFDRAPFLETERSALATVVFLTREDRVPSSESYWRMLVPKLASRISRAPLSSSRSCSTFCFSASDAAMAFRFLAPCDRPFAEPHEVVSSSSCFVAFASCFFLLFLFGMLNFHKFRRSCCGFCLDSFLYFRLLCRNLCSLLLC